MTRAAVLLTALTIACAMLGAMPADAQQTYTAVSASAQFPSGGQCGKVSNPCRTLQEACNVTAENGVIDVITPGEYGPVNITHAVSIEGHGWATVTQPGDNAIAINANNTDKINIRGVLLDGVGSGVYGILFSTGASLNIQGSMIRNFSQAGIFFQPGNPAQLFVSNTLVSDSGIGIQTNNQSGGTAVGGVIEHAEIENNSSYGFEAENSGNYYIANSAVVNNGGTGVFAYASTVRVTRSTVKGNGTGWGASNGGVVSTFADNNMIDNNTPETGSSNPPPNNPYE
jgi:hypothetical protein